MIVAGDHILHVVGLHRAEEAVDKARLGRERGLEVGRERSVGQAVAITGVVTVHLGTEHVVLVIATQHILVGEHKGVGVGGTGRKRAIDPAHLRGNVAGVVIGRLKLIQQHEGHVAVIEGVGNAVIGQIGRCRGGKTVAHRERGTGRGRRRVVGQVASGGHERRRDVGGRGVV